MGESERHQQEDARVRNYLRSKKFRGGSWLCAALIIASFLVPAFQMWILYVAGALSVALMVPVFRSASLNRKLELRRDRRLLLLVVIYVGATVLGVFIFAYYAAKH